MQHGVHPTSPMMDDVVLSICLAVVADGRSRTSVEADGVVARFERVISLPPSSTAAVIL
jgi:hypothetical protein